MATTSWGTPALDIGAGVRAQLGRDGVAVVDAARCTRESADLYSYRRDGDAAGRFAALVRLRGPDERPRPGSATLRAGANLAAVRERIGAAARAAGRDPAEVRLIVVTKFFPAEDVRLLADLGVCDVGENRHQEAEAKAAACADLGLAWHFIGGLQSNKAAAVARYAAAVHSLDRAKLVGPLSRGARERADLADGLDVPRPGQSRPAGGGRTAAARPPRSCPPSSTGCSTPRACGCGA